MDVYVIRRPSAWRNKEELAETAARSAKIVDEMGGRVRWIRTYVVTEADGRLGAFCIYQGRDPESIREHARRVGMPGEDFYKVDSTVIVNADPLEPARSSEAA